MTHLRRAAMVLSICIAAIRLAAGPAVPERLTDAEFWALVGTMSEPGGAFHSDNFTSNEAGFAPVVPTLAASGLRGGAYLGVGPEQNFHYIAALHPAISFIIDIRRQALMEQLLFKAIFELSRNRADFLALLFSAPPPSGATAGLSARDLMAAFPSRPGTDRGRYESTLVAVMNQLTKVHGFALSPEDRMSFAYVFEAFFKFGPAINYDVSVGAGIDAIDRSFAALNVAVDAGGTARGFLASEDTFRVVKTAEERNLIVPLAGDFAGPRTIRAVGKYLRDHDVIVSAFYISNVEQYLFNSAAPGARNVNGGWQAFYDNVATLPLDDKSTFIRVTGSILANRPDTLALCRIAPFLDAVKAGKVKSRVDADACPQ